MKGVVELDRREREKKERRARGEPSEDEDDQAAAEKELLAAETGAKEVIPAKPAQSAAPEEELASDEEYLEVEVTDDEDAEGDGPSKRQRMEDETMANKPLEFTEEDMAYQLQAMGQDYGLDPGEYGMDDDGEWEEGAEGLQLTEADSKALFRDLLDDFNINPYGTWEKIIEDGFIIQDDRYVALPNMKSRRETFDEWCNDKIRILKKQREKQEKQDPRIPYLAFLQSKANPKYYWPEFKRMHRKEPEMKDTKVNDKDREKYYREHTKRLQLPQSQLKSDLKELLESMPL
ncbi:hypothetical protein LTS18_001881, partial [Coniosporium uncinatum]